MTYDASRFTDTLVDEAIRKVVSGRVSKGLPALHLNTYDNVREVVRVLLEVDRLTFRGIKISDAHNAFAIERVNIARKNIHREQFESAAAAAAAALVAAPPQPSAPSATLNLDVAIEGLHPEGRRGGRLARRAADNSIVEIARRDAVERGWAVDTMFDPRLPRGVGAEPFDAAALHVEDDRSSSCGCELGWNASLIPKLVARLSADVAALPRADRELREHVVLQGPTFYSRGVQTLVLPGSVCESLTDQGAYSRHGNSASLDYIALQTRFNCSLRRCNLPCLARLHDNQSRRGLHDEERASLKSRRGCGDACACLAGVSALAPVLPRRNFTSNRLTQFTPLPTRAIPPLAFPPLHSPRVTDTSTTQG